MMLGPFIYYFLFHIFHWQYFQKKTLRFESKTSATLGGTKHLITHDHVTFFNLFYYTDTDQVFQVSLMDFTCASNPS